MVASSLLAWTIAAAAQAPSALTPGAVALLVNRDDGQYRPALRMAIADADARVRAVAARVAAVRRQGDMVPPLRDALAAETDPIAAAEQKRALRLIEAAAAAASVSGESATATPPAEVVRTMPPIVPGLLASVAEASGCTPAKYGAFGIARVSFDGAGVPARTAIDPSELPGPCKPILSTLARLSLVEDDPSAAGARTQYLLLPIDREFVECGMSAPVPPLEERPSFSRGRGLVPPRKTRDVRPQYPPAAQKNRRQGLVVVTARVTDKGCVNEARVTKGIEPSLDLAALRAVAGWQFDPASLDGKPVPFLMTVTVSFNLR